MAHASQPGDPLRADQAALPPSILASEMWRPNGQWHDARSTPSGGCAVLDNLQRTGARRAATCRSAEAVAEP